MLAQLEMAWIDRGRSTAQILFLVFIEHLLCNKHYGLGLGWKPIDEEKLKQVSSPNKSKRVIKHLNQIQINQLDIIINFI